MPRAAAEAEAPETAAAVMTTRRMQRVEVFVEGSMAMEVAVPVKVAMTA